MIYEMGLPVGGVNVLGCVQDRRYVKKMLIYDVGCQCCGNEFTITHDALRVRERTDRKGCAKCRHTLQKAHQRSRIPRPPKVGDEPVIAFVDRHWAVPQSVVGKAFYGGPLG